MRGPTDCLECLEQETQCLPYLYLLTTNLAAVLATFFPPDQAQYCYISPHPGIVHNPVHRPPTLHLHSARGVMAQRST